MTPDELRKKTQRLKEETAAVREFWLTTLPEDFAPDNRQCQVWLQMYGGLDNVIAGLERTQQWLQQRDQDNEERREQGKPPLPAKNKLDIVKYASGVMRNIDRGIEPQGNGDGR
jgi:hypothetical protein